MLNIEVICDDLIAYLKAHLPAQLDTVVATAGTRVPVAPPRNDSYFLGEYSRFRPYVLPACFVIPTRSPRAADGQNIDKWNHEIIVDFLVEGAEETSLTRAVMRLADAAHNTIKDQDITRSGVTNRGTKVFVTAIDYGPMIASKSQDGRPFRKDAFLTVNILHYDQATPVG